MEIQSQVTGHWECTLRVSIGNSQPGSSKSEADSELVLGHRMTFETGVGPAPIFHNVRRTLGINSNEGRFFNTNTEHEFNRNQPCLFVGGTRNASGPPGLRLQLRGSTGDHEFEFDEDDKEETIANWDMAIQFFSDPVVTVTVPESIERRFRIVCVQSGFLPVEHEIRCGLRWTDLLNELKNVSLIDGKVSGTKQGSSKSGPSDEEFFERFAIAENRETFDLAPKCDRDENMLAPEGAVVKGRDDERSYLILNNASEFERRFNEWLYSGVGFLTLRLAIVARDVLNIIENNQPVSLSSRVPAAVPVFPPICFDSLNINPSQGNPDLKRITNSFRPTIPTAFVSEDSCAPEPSTVPIQLPLEILSRVQM